MGYRPKEIAVTGGPNYFLEEAGWAGFWVGADPSITWTVFSLMTYCNLIAGFKGFKFVKNSCRSGTRINAEIAEKGKVGTETD